MSEARDKKAQALLQEAGNALKRWTPFGLGKEGKYEDAASAYEKAAAQFKGNKKPDEAAAAYVKAAECLEKINNTIEATTHWKNAGTQFIVANKADNAVLYLGKAIENYKTEDQFNRAARLQSQIGKMFEEAKENDKAIDFYNDAAESYEMENDTAQAAKQKLQIADIYAMSEKYPEAITIYEKVSKEHAGDQLRRWGVKNHLTKASLCHLVLGARAHDMKKAEDAISKYEDLSDIFAGTRENKFVAKVRELFDEDKSQELEDAILEFDKISRLTDFQVDVLTKIQSELKKEGPDKTPPPPNLAGGGDDDEEEEGAMPSLK